MGHAVVKMPLDFLAEHLGIREHLDVVVVLSPGADSLIKRQSLIVVESPVFPPVGPGMAYPEIRLMYEMVPGGGYKFKGFDYVGERIELPPIGEPPDLETSE